MKTIIKSILTVAVSATVFISFTGDTLAACVRETGDAGRWRDAQRPSDRIATMCRRGQTYYRASRGKMILQNLNRTDCRDLVQYAKNQESWSRDWFLWSDIKCDRGMRMYIK